VDSVHDEHEVMCRCCHHELGQLARPCPCCPLHWTKEAAAAAISDASMNEIYSPTGGVW
jgi:hypothetical protein